MKDFDLEKWAINYAESLTRIEPARFTRSDIIFAHYRGAVESKELYDQQLAELKQEIWDAARAGITIGAIGMPEICVPIGDDSECFKYKSLSDYESKKDGQE
jgi:hypothetical protein